MSEEKSQKDPAASHSEDSLAGPQKQRAFYRKKRPSIQEKAEMLASEDDEETKTEKALRTMPKGRYWVIAALSLFFLGLQFYIKLVKPLDSWVQTPLHLCLSFILSFLLSPLAEKHHKKGLWLIDGLLIAGAVFVSYYYVSNASFFDTRLLFIKPMRPIDLAAGIVLILITLEAVRRCVSGILLVFILIFISYAFVGQHIPGIFRFSGISWQRLIETITLGQNGIFGAPLIASVGTLFYFMIFGAFFANTGGGDVLIDCGMKLSNKTVGGPAKAAVISSGLMGMISGSAVANVSTTGVLTIPLMKKAGYSPEEAGAVESVASTGGQIMPPIMGVGAFIMAEIIGVKYTDIALSAIIPAAAYFYACFMIVHLLAKKKNIKNDAVGLKQETKPILPRLYRLLPMIVLIFMLYSGFSLPRSAIYCTALSVIIGALSEETRRGPKQLLNTLIEGVKQAAYVALPTAGCGIMIGIVIQSGVAVKIAKLVGASGNSSLFLALVIAAIGCILLGMALPTSAAYLIGNVLFCSAIVGLGIGTLSANMFLFYFGVIAQITPPVCLASYTAAGIAGASAWKTGWKAFSFSITAFLVPFLFVYQPAILLMGTTMEIIKSCIVVLLGTTFLACGITGYFAGRDMKAIERVVFLASAIGLILPSTWSDLVGLIIGALACGYCFIMGRHGKKTVIRP